MILSSFFFFALLHQSLSLPHISLQRKEVPTSRLFSLRHRPWATNLPIQPTLNLPIKLLNNSRALPQHAIHGSIIPLGEYYITLTFGGQPINVQIDTGSSTIAVPLKECLNCRRNDHRLDISKASGTAGFIGCDSPLCRRDSCNMIPACTTCSKKSRACCSTNAPSACGFFLQYADSSGASGALVQSDVTIAGMTVPVVFGAILQETAEFEATSVDGIFGMAYKSLACNPTCVTPLFDTLVESGKVKHDIFSICTAPSGGTLILGGSDPKFYEGDLQYVPIIHKSTPNFYAVAVKSTSIGNRQVKLPHFSSAIVDSGTTILVVSLKTYETLRSHFQKYYCDVPGLCTAKVPGPVDESARVIKMPASESGGSPNLETAERATEASWFSPGYCGVLTEKHINMLPNITIHLENNVNLVLEPSTYMLEYEMASSFGFEPVVYRCLGISYLEGMEMMQNDVILGDTALQKYFVEYDRENSRLGLAVARNCGDPAARQVNDDVIAEEGGFVIPTWAVHVFTVASIVVWVVVIRLCTMEVRKRQGYAQIPNNTAA